MSCSSCCRTKPNLFLALLMRNKQSLICFLLGYLVLLWNLGPSFHRADFLGFHSHAAEIGDFQPSCCCCHSRSGPQTDVSTESVSSNADHDCAFCKFFDQLHLVVSQADMTESEDRIFLVEAVDLIRINAAHTSPSARGPPATS